MTNNASAFALGDHAGVYVHNSGDPWLYDPGGSYVPPGMSAPEQLWAGADVPPLSNYVEYQMTDGGKVNAYIFDTSAAEESAIVSRLENAPRVAGGWCAYEVSRALSGVGVFGNLGISLRPDGLASDLDGLCEKLKDRCTKLIFQR